MAAILFEHPLDELTSNFLRVETLFSRVDVLINRFFAIDHHFCLLCLFEIADLDDQFDLSAQILAQLNAQKAKLNGFRGLAKDLNLPDGWDKKELNVQASGGEKKKNELIQMKMLDPNVAILDEPDSGLDVDAINSLIEQLEDFNSEDKTIIIVSHYEKLLKSFEPSTVTVVANGTATRRTIATTS